MSLGWPWGCQLCPRVPVGDPDVPWVSPLSPWVSLGCVPWVSPLSPCPCGCHLYTPGSRQCPRCLITFPDPSFAARHAKRQHPGDFARAALRGALFVCFVCSRPFGSSPALLRHQRGHAHPRKAAPPARQKAPPPPAKATPTLSCAECGRAFAREGALHRHYIRHARGEV
uniref:C2H2-type domain-containing protein n=1 Tax=Cyanoderma ruficeps TaxID=181631 RepID=A0A8C3NX71_9PASS